MEQGVSHLTNEALYTRVTKMKGFLKGCTSSPGKIPTAIYSAGLKHTTAFGQSAYTTALTNSNKVPIQIQIINYVLSECSTRTNLTATFHFIAIALPDMFCY